MRSYPKAEVTTKKKNVQRRNPVWTEEDAKAVRRHVSGNRWRLKSAKAAWEEETGRTAGYSALRRFF